MSGSLLEQVSQLHLVGVSIGAGLGAMCRAALDRGVVARFGPPPLPWATLAVNVAGSFLLGLVLAWPAGLATGTEASETVRLVVGTGFCGGLTTFSTFSYESFLLLREGRARGAQLYVGLTVGLGMAAVVLGDTLGTALG